MKNKNRKRNLPRNQDFTLDGDHIAPYYKRLFRFVRMDNSMPVLRKVEITPELFMGLWGIERHLLKIIKIQDSLSTGQPIDWEQVEEGTAYPETLLRRAYQILKEEFGTEQPVLNEEFLREIHESICSAFRIVFPKPCKESAPKAADGFYNRGNQRIFQKRYEEALADFTRANELEPNNHLYEFSIGQYWFRYGHDSQTALTWIDKAISHIRSDDIFELICYHELRLEICSAIGEYHKSVKSLQIATGTLCFLIERLDWKDGEASLGRGKTIYAEGIQASLSQEIQNAEHLLTRVDSVLASQVQEILGTLKKLWKQL
jgi:tetratricopeptide (TPR) repeat protein